MDIQLPDISGIEVYARLRADPSTAVFRRCVHCLGHASRPYPIMDADLPAHGKADRLKEFLQQSHGFWKAT